MQIEDYLNHISGIRRYSARTTEIYRSALEDYAAFCDDPDPVPTVSAVRAYEVHLLDERKFNPKTVNLHLSILSGYCRFLVGKGVLASNPVRLVSRPKTPKRLPVFYRDESMKEYLDSTRGTIEFGSYEDALARMVVGLLYGTGIRRSELISLNNDSVDWSRRTLRVHGKGDVVREIPLVDALCEEISLYLRRLDSLKYVQTGPQAPLLQTPRGGRLYPMLVQRIVGAELGGVGSITSRKSPHVLRHTLATQLLSDGADLNSIKELLGHSSLAATQVYTHNSIERLKSVYNQAHPRATKKGGNDGNQN